MKIKKVVEVEVEVELEKGDIFGSDTDEFKPLVDTIINDCKFVGGSSHDNIVDYFGYNQGGSNTCDVSSIEVLDVCYTYNKLTLLIDWNHSSSIIIVKYD